jgi:hypothetical protein
LNFFVELAEKYLLVLAKIRWSCTYSQSQSRSDTDSHSQASQQCKKQSGVIVARGTRNVALSRMMTVGELLSTVCTVYCTFATQ